MWATSKNQYGDEKNLRFPKPQVVGPIPAEGASSTWDFPARATISRHLMAGGFRQDSSFFVGFRWSAVGQPSDLPKSRLPTLLSDSSLTVTLSLQQVFL
jgi:hypothetical protein